RRIRLERQIQADPYLVGEFAELPDVVEESREVEALTRNVQGLFARIIGLVPYLPEELQIAAANVDDPSALCNLVASTLRLKAEEKRSEEHTSELQSRFELVCRLLLEKKKKEPPCPSRRRSPPIQ